MDKEYDSYIPVNQKWVERIPAHWEMKRLKAVFAMRKERNNPIQTEFILSLTAKQGVVPYAEKEGAGGNKPKEDLTQYNVCHKNDLLVNCMNVVSGAAGVSRYYGAISPVYYAFYPREDSNIWYYHYIFRLVTFQRSLIGLGKGILMHESDEGVLTSVRMRISMDYLGNVLLPIPPRTEQDQIVRFLDWKVSEINRLINIKHKEIHRLSQIIQQLITNEMQGEKIWLKRLLLSPLQYGANSSGTVLTEGLPRYVRITDIDSNGNLKMDGAKSITLQDSKQYILEDGDVLLARSGATVGKAFLYKNSYGFCAYAGYLIRAKLNRKVILPEYFLYFTKSSEYMQWKDSVFIQATIQNISADRYGRLPVPVPDVETQKRIVAKLDVVTEKIKTEIKILEKEIATLQEYKTRLISDVVTGQIDVRNIEVPEYEFVDEDNDFEADDNEELEEVEEQED